MNKYRKWLEEAEATGKLGHSTKSVLKLQADAHDEGYEEASKKILDWNSFREWYKKRYGWYPGDSIPMSFTIYLKEMKDEEHKTRVKETTHVLP